MPKLVFFIGAPTAGKSTVRAKMRDQCIEENGSHPLELDVEDFYGEEKTFVRSGYAKAKLACHLGERLAWMQRVGQKTDIYIEMVGLTEFSQEWMKGLSEYAFDYGYETVIVLVKAKN